MASLNTSQRLTSAAILISGLALFLWWGKIPCQALLLVAGILLHDEIYTNFFRHKRDSIFYLFSLSLYIFPYAALSLRPGLDGLWTLLILLSLCLNGFLMLYIFLVPMNSPLLLNVKKQFPYIAGPFVFLSTISLASLFQHGNWRKAVIVLFVLNILVDSGGWFFGKRLGKHKLWQEVSPKKTVEGLLGGVLTSWVLTSMLWYFLFDELPWALSFFFFGLGFLSQLGDLIQSKMKRQFDIKDSSSLIPGHGGLYDRLDAIIFTSPFFAFALRLFY